MAARPWYWDIMTLKISIGSVYYAALGVVLCMFYEGLVIPFDDECGRSEHVVWQFRAPRRSEY